jgi:hypothetical protein
VLGPVSGDTSGALGRLVDLVRKRVPEFVDTELLAGFKRLRKRGVLRLTKPDSRRYHAYEYSGNDADDDVFFFHRNFNASITDEDRSEWDRMEPPKNIVLISHIGEKGPWR